MAVQIYSYWATLMCLTLAASTASFIPQTTPCMNGWMANNGSCYLFGHGNKMHFFEAQHYCEHFKAALVHIEDIHENRFLMSQISLLKDAYFWIGLTDEMVEGEWKWVDTDTSPLYTAWRPGQPNGGAEDCAATRDTLGWDDYRCDASDFYPLCEMRPEMDSEIIG